MYDIPLIKSRLSCIDYAQRIGLPIRRDGDRCKSPLRDGADNKSAFSVHNDYWHDFVSGESGDVIDLAALVNHKGDRGLAIQELARITGVFLEEDYIDWRQRTQRRVSLIQGWHEDLRPYDRDYLHGRGITDDTIARLRIGYTGIGTDYTINGDKIYGFAAGRICIPAYKNGYVVTWVARAIHGEQKPKYIKPPNEDTTESEPFGLHTLDRKTPDLYIAEGAFDYLSLEQDGRAVLATMGGRFGKETIKHVLSICKDFQRVVLTFDNDEAGRSFTKKLGDILFSRGLHFAVAEIPHKYKDIADYYADGGRIDALVLQEGVDYLAKTILDKDEFKSFAYKAARLMDRAELTEMLSKVGKAEQFSEVWLKEVRAACYKSPPETVVVREILSKHNLLYLANVGFYEYRAQGRWVQLNDEVVHGYISDTLGGFAAGGKLDPIKKLLRAEVLTTHEFDRKPVVNFLNGTLELDSGLFRDHSEDDYCSIQFPYPYLPEARAPRWQKFVREVTAEDAKREENLQFIAGYTLFSDCRHEKIFVLTGEGGNGKSIYTRVLNQLFGPENVTHITPAGIVKDFERIHLRSALLNIAGEIKSDITGAEEYLKQLATGEGVQACYKGKDYISFQSRAKMIFACNGQLRSSDTSDGLARRLLIVDFPCKFTDYPDKDDPYQLQRDIGLYDKLMDELPGIFNWAYEGYRDLLRYGEFTENSDHQALMQAFRKASNPIESFVEDFLDDNIEYISTRTLYERYRTWCVDNGHMPCSANRFHPDFKRVTRKSYEYVDRSLRTATGPRRERGYEKLNTFKL